MSLGLALAGAGVGLLVGLTGAGGGALMTPVLVVCFGLPPTVAVSSDLVATLGIRPVAAAVHAVRGTVRWPLVGWLTAGSVPGAFAGAAVLAAGGHHHRLDHLLLPVLGAVLLAGTACSLWRAVSARPVRTAASRGGAWGGKGLRRAAVVVGIGLVAGFLVGLTSTGSGSLLLVALPIVAPELSLGEVVGTDLAQSVPLTAAASVALVAFGQLHLAVVGSVLLGGVPGALAGSWLAGLCRTAPISAVMAAAVTAAGLHAVGVPSTAVLAGAPTVPVVGALATARRRRRDNQLRAEPWAEVGPGAATDDRAARGRG
jgi:uncharacterized membrane protein YfcA